MRAKLGQCRMRREDLKKAAFDAAQGCIDRANGDEIDRRSCQAGVLELIKALQQAMPPMIGSRKKRRR